MKKLLSFFLTIATLFVSVPIIHPCAVTAEENFGQLAYTVSEGEIIITGCSKDATEIIIPDTIEGYPVTTINDAAFIECASLTKIIMPDSVTAIGESAFSCCTSLTDIQIPSKVTTIGEYAFYGCSSITEIEIPEGVADINEHTFYDCSSLQSIVLPISLKKVLYRAFNNTSLSTVYYNGSQVEWDQITIHRTNTDLNKATLICALIHVCEIVEVEAIEPTCTHVGYTAGTKCFGCGKVYSGLKLIPAGHVLGDWIIISEPTETTPGLKVRTCANCNYGEEVGIPVIIPTFKVIINGEETEYLYGDTVSLDLPSLVYSDEDSTWYRHVDWTAEGIDIDFTRNSLKFTMPHNDVIINSSLRLHGDCDKDGIISAADAFFLIVCLKNATADTTFDISLDGKVTALDKVELLKVIKGTFSYS